MEYLIGALVGALGALVLAYVVSRTQSDALVREARREGNEQGAAEALKGKDAALRGQIGERFAPFVPGFGHEPADARFLGSPIDYVVFKGMATGQVSELVFVEVKTGRLPLTPFQKQVQQAIDEHRVSFRIVELDG